MIESGTRIVRKGRLEKLDKVVVVSDDKNMRSEGIIMNQVVVLVILLS